MRAGTRCQALERIANSILLVDFRFAQQFIDVRENERKRLQRGIITVPSVVRKQNQTEKSEANNGSSIQNTPSLKAEHLLELQEKITREILSTKLAESEMNELQVIVASISSSGAKF